MAHSPSSPTMTSSSSSSTSSSKKSRRFSLIRLFNNSSCTSSASASLSSSPCSSASSSPTTTRPLIPAHHRHSMAPTMDTMQNEMMRERRKSIAALTDKSTFRSMSLDLRRPSSSIRPLISSSSRKDSTTMSPQKRAEMTEKMRQFDELLLQGSRSSTIRISLTPSLLQ